MQQHHIYFSVESICGCSLLKIETCWAYRHPLTNLKSCFYTSYVKYYIPCLFDCLLVFSVLAFHKFYICLLFLINPVSKVNLAVVYSLFEYCPRFFRYCPWFLLKPREPGATLKNKLPLVHACLFQGLPQAHQIISLSCPIPSLLWTG